MIKTILTITFFQILICLNAQTFKLADENTIKKLTINNREFEIINENNNSYIRFNEGKTEGTIWLPIEDFANGIVEIKLRGKNVVQRSFIGIAFHGKNDTTYDAVYCRPFNFYTTDSIRKVHAIQYISHPVYTWKKLREEQNGKYEKEISNAPLPNDWFTLKLIIKRNKILAYVNDKKVFSVKKLSKIYKGKIGIFMGSNSGGDFDYVKILNYKKW